jgi:type VI secretion system ImpB/VipA family protein
MWHWVDWLQGKTAKRSCSAESSRVLRHLKNAPAVDENTAFELSRLEVPRVRLTYDVHHAGSITRSELPFVVGVLADFQGRSSKRLPLKERSFQLVDRSIFDEVMGCCDVRLQLRVSQITPESEKEQLLDFRFASLEDFAPSSIASQIALATNQPIEGNPLLATQVAIVLHHPDFLKLEGTWRGLHYMVNHVQAHPQLEVKILNLSKNELAFELVGMPEVEESRIYRRIIDDTYGLGAPKPFGVLIGDYHFTHDPTDVEVLTKMAELGAAACCPFLVGASPGIFGLQNWSELPQDRNLAKQTDSTAHSAWNRFRDCDDARYVVLTGPRTLGRPPYPKGTIMGSGGEFGELAFDPDSQQAAGYSRLC